MAAVKVEAEKTLVAVCAFLSISVIQDKNFPVWLDVIRGVLPDCDQCPLSMASLRAAASSVVSSPPGQHQNNAMSRLNVETRQYYAMVAAARTEAWRDAKDAARSAA